AHTPFGELPLDLVGPQDLPHGDGRGRRLRLAVEEAIGLGGGEQGLELLPQVRIVAAAAIEPGGPLVRRPPQSPRQQGPGLLPVGGRHAAGPPSLSRRYSQALAVAHSRLTVAAESPRAAAVSSMPSPAKKRSSITCACRSSSRPSSVSAASR